MDDLLTAADTAARLQVSLRWVQTLCKSARVPGARKVGRDWLIPAAVLPHIPRQPRGRPRKA
jgi:hypothetical protein